MSLPDAAASVLATIGRTPVVKLSRLRRPARADVFVKLEYFNPTGSYKDRMALAMIEGAERRGALRPGMRVVEYTGRQHRFVARHGLRRQGLSLRTALVRRVRAGEDPDDGGVRRAGGDARQRGRQGHAGTLHALPRAD